MMESKEIREISLEDLKLYTDNFSEDNFIGKFQYGKAYRGKIGYHDVTVKVWSIPKLYRCRPGENETRMKEELILHTDSRIKSHPNVAKLIGCCHEGQLAVVYDINPVDTLQNFILRDDFTWRQRIKVALQLACLLEFLHTPCPPHLPYLVRNIDAAHFLLDKDLNLVLYDFGMFTGGLLPDRRSFEGHREFGCYGYIDPFLCRSVEWCPENDVWAFGVILLGVIAKKVFVADEDSAIGCAAPDGAVFVDEWALKEYERRQAIFGDKVSLVDKSMEVDPDFESDDGLEITKLGMQCLEVFWNERPQMEEVVQRLLKLQVLLHNLKPAMSGLMAVDDLLSLRPALRVV